MNKTEKTFSLQSQKNTPIPYLDYFCNSHVVVMTKIAKHNWTQHTLFAINNKSVIYNYTFQVVAQIA